MAIQDCQHTIEYSIATIVNAQVPFPGSNCSRIIPDADHSSIFSATLGKVAQKIRHLHFTVNSVEEQYEKTLANMTALDTGTLPKPMADDFKLLHKRTEMVLHQLADFFKIPIDAITGTTGNSKHRYHEVVIHVFKYSDNPLTPILGCRDVQEILFAWKNWRNKWAAPDPDLKVESVDEGNSAFTRMPKLVQKLREAISEANSIARHGVQVIRGERGKEQMDDPRDQHRYTTKDSFLTTSFLYQKAADKQCKTQKIKQKGIPIRGGRPSASYNIPESIFNLVRSVVNE